MEIPSLEWDKNETEVDTSKVSTHDPLVDMVKIPGLDNSGESIDTSAFFTRDTLQSGERQLAFATIQVAVDDYLRQAKSAVPSEKRKFVKTMKWFLDDDTSWPYAFVPLCHALDVDEDVLRENLVKWRKLNAPESFEPIPPRRRRKKK